MSVIPIENETEHRSRSELMLLFDNRSWVGEFRHDGGRNHDEGQEKCDELQTLDVTPWPERTVRTRSGLVSVRRIRSLYTLK